MTRRGTGGTRSLDALEREPDLAWIALSRIQGLGRESVRRLLDRHESAVRVLARSADEVAAVCGARAAAAWPPELDVAELQRVHASLARCGARLVPSSAPDFPALLREIPDPPWLLYAQGPLPPSRGSRSWARGVPARAGARSRARSRRRRRGPVSAW